MVKEKYQQFLLHTQINGITTIGDIQPLCKSLKKKMNDKFATRKY